MTTKKEEMKEKKKKKHNNNNIDDNNSYKQMCPLRFDKRTAETKWGSPSV